MSKKIWSFFFGFLLYFLYNKLLLTSSTIFSYNICLSVRLFRPFWMLWLLNVSPSVGSVSNAKRALATHACDFINVSIKTKHYFWLNFFSWLYNISGVHLFSFYSRTPKNSKTLVVVVDGSDDGVNFIIIVVVAYTSLYTSIFVYENWTWLRNWHSFVVVDFLSKCIFFYGLKFLVSLPTNFQHIRYKDIRNLCLTWFVCLR